MKLLALDTSTESCSVALWLDGAVSDRGEIGRRHGELLLPMVQQVLAGAGVALTQLDAIAFGRGPGSFTSLRLGAGVVQGLAFGADLPVVPISSLAALAQGVDSPKVLAAFDARMQQVYWGEYIRAPGGLVALASGEIVADPLSVPLPQGQGWTGAGSGWDAYHAALAERLGSVLHGWHPGLHPRARDVARLATAELVAGRAVAPEVALPVYLRDEVAFKKSRAS